MEFEYLAHDCFYILRLLPCLEYAFAAGYTYRNRIILWYRDGCEVVIRFSYYRGNTGMQKCHIVVQIHSFQEVYEIIRYSYQHIGLAADIVD